MRRGYLGSLSVSSMVVFPVLTAMAVPAPELLTGILGAKWAPAAAPFQILAAGGAAYCIYNLSDSLVRAKGAVYLKFLSQSAYAAAVIAGALAGWRWGVSGVAVGLLGAMSVGYLLMARLSLKLVGCSWRSFFLAQWPGVVTSCAAAVAALPVVACRRAAALPPLAILAVSGLASAAAAGAATLSLPRGWLHPTVWTALQTLKGASLDRRAWQAMVARYMAVSGESPRTSSVR
jgi:PST family polysaccharide transporter